MFMESQKIRWKFRQEIRTRQIQQYMKFIRTQALRSCAQQNTFISLDRKIKESANLPNDERIIKQLITLLESHPQHQNTYILISNYLVDHDDAWKDFDLRVLGMSCYARNLDNYKRVLIILLSKIQKITIDRLIEYDKTIAQIIQHTKNERQLSQCFNILQLILQMLNVQRQQKYLPKKCVEQFFKQVCQSQLKYFQADTKYHIIKTVYQIGIDHLNNDVIKNYIPDIVRVIVFGIADYCSFRSDFIVILKCIAIDYYQQFEAVFRSHLGSALFQELAYVYTNLPRERSNILTIIESILDKFTMDSMIRLLNLKIHIIIVSCLKNLHPNELKQCLSIILFILNKIQQSQQLDLLYQVQNSLQQQHFQAYLQDLMTQRQDPNVEKVLHELIDEFYSEQVS